MPARSVRTRMIPFMFLDLTSERAKRRSWLLTTGSSACRFRRNVTVGERLLEGRPNPVLSAVCLRTVSQHSVEGIALGGQPAATGDPTHRPGGRAPRVAGSLCPTKKSPARAGLGRTHSGLSTPYTPHR